jgi:hypothetical protein
VGAGLRRHDVIFAEATCHNFSVTPAKAGAYASFRGRAAGSVRVRSIGTIHRLMKLIAVPAAAVFLGSAAASAQTKPDAAGISTQAIAVEAKPIASFSKSGTPSHLGRLEWRGGLVLTSSSRYFGGWSGLALDNDGKSFIAVSDAGLWMTGELAYDGTRPKAMRGARIGSLLTAKGKPLSRGRDRDSESISLLSGTPAKGTAYIAFEQHDRIGIFALDKNGLGKPASYMMMPKEAVGARSTDGIEATAVLTGGPRKGAPVAFAEHPLRGEKMHRGWIWISGKPQTFTVPGLGDYGVTDAAALPDGSVLIVERRFRWFDGVRIRLRLLAAEGIKPGGTARGEILLQADSTSEIDNLEALAVSQGARGETVITLMSDDNYNRFLQRTLLLQFTLKERATAQAQ